MAAHILDSATRIHDVSPPSDTRQRILDAAMRCFVSSGFHNASMQQICAAAQMSPGGVYRHFASKDAIIAAIVEHMSRRNRQFFGRIAEEGATLETFFDASFAFLREVVEGPEGGLCCEVMAEAQRNPSIRAAFEVTNCECRQMLRRVVERMQADGAIEPTLDAGDVANTLMAIGDGLIVSRPFTSATPIDVIEPGLRQLVARMLQPRSDRSKTKELAS